MAFLGAILETAWVDLRLSRAAKRMERLKIVQNIQPDEDDLDTKDTLGLDTPPEKIKERSNLIKFNERKKDKELDKYKKINNQVLMTAKKYAPDSCKIDYDIEQQILYKLVRSAWTLTGLLTRAQKTQEWINYCYYFMTNKEAPLLVHISDSTKALCNGICNIYGFGKMYPDANIANLKVYDCFDDCFGTSPEFVLSVSKLQANNTAEMQLAIANKKGIIDSVATELDNEAYDPNRVVPIKFSTVNDANTITDKSISDIKGNLPDNTFMILEGYIKPILDKMAVAYYYDLSPYTGRVIITVDRSGFPETYEIDLSTLGYNNYSMVANTTTGNRILVPLYETHIIENLLASCFHMVSDIEEKYLYSKMFKDLWIYKIVDLGDLDTKKMDTTEMNNLSQAISCLFGWCQSENLVIPRMRFCSYESPDKFTLVSDLNCRNPLADIDDTEGAILDGLVMVKDGDNMSYRYGDIAKMI